MFFMSSKMKIYNKTTSFGALVYCTKTSPNVETLCTHILPLTEMIGTNEMNVLYIAIRPTEREDHWKPGRQGPWVPDNSARMLRQLGPYEEYSDHQ